MSEDSSTIGTTGSVFGIDLGTTFSSIAYLDSAQKAQTIPNSSTKKKVTPSVVYIQSPVQEGMEPEILAGEAALSKEDATPECIHRLFKRHMAEKNAEIEINGKQWTPTDLSAEVLKGMVEDAKTQGFDVHDVVITHPAYFSPEEIKETKRAGEMAGLNVISMLPEPVAAALSYGMNHIGETRTILVYDLGGGTFDVTIVRIGDNKFKVLDWAGRKTLGGADWDEKIREWAIEESGVPREEITDDADAWAELCKKSTAAKIDLSSTDNVKIMFSPKSGRRKIDLSREKFEELTSELLQETRGFVEALFQQARNGELRNAPGEIIQKVDDILLVGGSSYMPQVQRMVKEAFSGYCDNEPLNADLDEAVAKGAALKALAEKLREAQTEEEDKIRITDPSKTDEQIKNEATTRVIQTIGAGSEGQKIIETLMATTTEQLVSRSFGLVAKVDGVRMVANLIRKGEKIPCEHEEEFKVENETGPGGKLVLQVYSSEVDAEVVDLQNNTLKLLDDTTVDAPNLKANSLIRVQFALSSDGILDIQSVDEQGNKYSGKVNTNG